MMICLSCTESTLKADLELIRTNKDFIDAVEIRADFLSPDEYSLLPELPSSAGVPCILTFRLPADGGMDSILSAAGRAGVMTGALRGGWAYVDIEDDADPETHRELIKTASENGTRVIRSFHDFSGVPENLVQRMIDNSDADRCIPKAAVMPKCSGDFIRLAEAFQSLSAYRANSMGYSCTGGPFLSDYILVGMGAFGFPSRIMAAAWGGMLTFASAGKTTAAPGHISPRQMVCDYNFKNITAKTDVFGIIGNPVMHTKSPMLHNEAMRKNRIDAVYLPFETDDPASILDNSELLNLKGLSVTIPHKQKVMGLAYGLDEAVEKIGACNTLVKKDGWFGYNTDWKGFLKPIETEKLGGERALVVGAGGASRAVVYALLSIGMEVTIVNRTAEKAAALAADFGCIGGGMDLLPRSGRPAGRASGFSLVVQTTSAGMEPDIDQNPLPGFDFTGVRIVYDIIYAPDETRFLAEARAAGCRTINGFPMLKAQAQEQFRLFTGCEME